MHSRCIYNKTVQYEAATSTYEQVTFINNLISKAFNNTFPHSEKMGLFLLTVQLGHCSAVDSKNEAILQKALVLV